MSFALNSMNSGHFYIYVFLFVNIALFITVPLKMEIGL